MLKSPRDYIEELEAIADIELAIDDDGRKRAGGN